MQTKTRFILAALAATVLAANALAGGFWLTIGNPEANSEAKAMNAAVTVMPSGCQPIGSQGDGHGGRHRQWQADFNPAGGEASVERRAVGHPAPGAG